MAVIELTEAAAYEVKDMMQQNDMPDGYLKLKVNGGGGPGVKKPILIQGSPPPVI